ncbi:unnamed protein product [Clonostachys rosea]|uniref:Uncharacterized protein n=1 Tax=Bionectria ochroleuca TaxID=29856 RepID=A0ABY6V005_BIOOC|nr:unnamed protein product [Clonostachys rosea]
MGEPQYNCQATVWLFKDEQDNVFQSPQRYLSKKHIVRYMTGEKTERATFRNTSRCRRTEKRMWTDAHGCSIASRPGGSQYRGERLWVIGFCKRYPGWVRVISLDTERCFRAEMRAISFVPRFQTVDSSGREHYITPVAPDWFVQWPVGQPELVERKEGPWPDEPTFEAALRKQNFRDEWAMLSGFTSGPGMMSAEQWARENEFEKHASKTLEEVLGTSFRGESAVTDHRPHTYSLPIRPSAQS